MCKQEEIQKLSKELMGTAEAMGQAISPNAAGLMAADLSDFPLEMVLQALHRTRIEERGRLTLAVVLQQLDALCGRPGPEEAWALALQAKDEAATVVWTDEIAQAWAVASPLANSRDTVGARMAFKEAYGRLTQAARAGRKRPVVQVSIGHDAAQRVHALTVACEQGLLSVEQAQEHLHGVAALEDGRLVALAAQRAPEIGYRPDGTPYKLPQAPVGIQRLLASATTTKTTTAPPAVLERLRELAQANAAQQQRRALAPARLQRMQQAQLKRQTEERVQQYIAQNPHLETKP